MQEPNFYSYKDGTKMPICKPCLTMHVDNFDEETFLWILQKLNVPYVPNEWNKIRDKAYAKDPKKMNGMSVLGKYLSLMKLKHWKNYTWEDTQKLQEKAEERIEKAKEEEQKIKQDFLDGKISQAQYLTLVGSDIQEQSKEETQKLITHKKSKTHDQEAIGEENFFNETYYISQEQLPDLGASLTLEDKQYLAMKWGRTYKPSEWIELQKKYTQMTESFDIQDADSKNTLIFICKTYLKMNQAIDCGDLEGYQKLSRVYDSLRKSAKFTAAQNKEKKDELLDSVGQLVAYCQKNGHKIPRFEIKTPYDIIDKVIADFKQYNKSLIYQDTALARQIQDYIKEARAANSMRKDREQAEKKGLENHQVSDQDIRDFKDFVREETENSLKKQTEEDS